MNNTELDYKSIAEHYVSDLAHYSRTFVTIAAVLKYGKSSELIKSDIDEIIKYELARIERISSELIGAGVEKHVEGFD